MTNLTPPSASADNEQSGELDKILFGCIVAVGVREGGSITDLDTLIIDRMKAVAALQAYIAHHTKEAEIKARIDENRLARNAMEPNEAKDVPYVVSFDLYTSERNQELEAELASSGQKGGDE